MFNLLTAFR